ADGRELFYFDDSPAYVSGEKTRELHDPRPLHARDLTQIPQMRRDPLTGEWIACATARMDRTFLPPADANPLAPAKPGATYQDGEIPATDYDVVVFENRFPSLLGAGNDLPLPPTPSAHPATDDVVAGRMQTANGDDLFLSAPAAGRCEVICFGPNLSDTLAHMSVRRMRTVIAAWADRTAQLGAMDGVRQVFCFENHGEAIGVTLHHPHGQIYAYPFTPPRTRALLAQATHYRKRTGRQLYGDVLEAELRVGTRIIAESDHWVVYVPYAAKWPVQAHLAPRRNVADLAELTDAERADLAPMYLQLLRAGNHFFDPNQPMHLPYIAAWNQSVIGDGRDDLRLHLDYFSIVRSPGKLKYLAGSESAMGAWISDTTPDLIAERFQEAFAAVGPVQEEK
ncbi:MAG: galactose-1-phosphate uridylyltransferase, partial [Bowdeniella nasicola]|nr:galactose-1-phosphate uridylyltransferase [Bowdeniella nasicola]